MYVIGIRSAYESWNLTRKFVAGSDNMANTIYELSEKATKTTKTTTT